jgi:hypothetical protein
MADSQGLDVGRAIIEEKGLALWGGVELDLDIQRLAKKTCACGAPAVVAIRKLDRQERIFLCESHRVAA